VRFKAAIFDMDGTLMDSLADIGNSINRLLAEKGFGTRSLDDYRDFIGAGARNLIARSLPDHARDEKTVQACLQDFREDYYRGKWNIETRTYPGIPALLRKLRECGIRMAVLSNKPQFIVTQAVAQIVDAVKFDAAYGHSGEIPLKPDPAGAMRIADDLAVDPEEIVYAGDTAVDMKTAIAGGMFPVGVLWGYQPEEVLLKNGARAVVRTPREILSVFEHCLG